MSRYPARFLDVDLMAAEDIDGLYPESVRIHLSRGSFDVSSRRRGVELLPPRHGLQPSHPPSPSPVFGLPLCLSICLSFSMCLLSERLGTKGEEKTSQYKVAFKISAPLKTIPP